MTHQITRYNPFPYTTLFRSQRWITKESANPDDMPETEIRKKFQLLSNQTNMWKSRYCDTCVKTGKRGDFMGTKWFYAGDENWGRSEERRVGTVCRSSG